MAWHAGDCGVDGDGDGERHLVLGKQEGVDVTQPDHRQADHKEGLHILYEFPPK